MICSFCEELETGELPFEFNLEVDSRIIVETENFVVVPDISPLALGHILIIPKDHILSFGEVKEEKRSELFILLEKTRRVLSKTYCNPLIMEHGSNGCFSGGACIIHAHLQIFPGKIDLRNSLSCFNVQRISNFWELNRWYQRGEPYIFLLTPEGEMFVADHIDGIKKQFIRFEIAKMIGLETPQWDWRWKILNGDKKEISSIINNTIYTIKKAWMDI